MLIVAITLERVSHYYHIVVVVLLLYDREHHIITEVVARPGVPAFICSTQRVKIATFCKHGFNFSPYRIIYRTQYAASTL